LIEQRWKTGEEFTFAEVYEAEPHFKNLYPSNLNIQDKLYQILQQLRDDDFVEFIDNQGTYRRK
jgi:hypothetical protein